MEELPFGLAQKDTYAALNPGDLESMGKQAARLYLSGDISLNDAIVKLAGEHPSISPHQIQRVIEFANVDTFNRMFEKQAEDKNIEFDVADPTIIMKQMDIGARGHEMVSQHSDYAMAPVKTAGISEVTADLELMRAFGVDPASPNSEVTIVSMHKVAADGSVDRVADRVMQKSAEPSDDESAADRILKSRDDVAGDERWPDLDKEEHTKQAFGPPPGQLMAGNDVESTDEQHHKQMLDLSRSVELEKKKQELAITQQKTQEALMGPQPGAVAQGGGSPAPMPGGGGQPTAEAAVAPQPPGPQKMAQDLTKQAMAVAKSSSAVAHEVIKDLERATSMARIKESSASKPEYPYANPYGELIRTKQRMEKLATDSRAACDKNERLTKEANARFCHAVGQHMLSGGEFGEVVHALDATGAIPEQIKLAMESAVGYLIAKGISGTDLQVDQIKYAMAAKEQRVINPNNPVVESFSTFLKLSHGQFILNDARNSMVGAYNKVKRTLQEASQSESSTRQ